MNEDLRSNTITADDLFRYSARKTEIVCLKQQLDSGLIVSDTVRGSDAEYPYTEHSITIKGYNERLSVQLKGKIDELIEKCERVDAWLNDGCAESDRVLFVRRFIQEWSLIKLGMEYGISDESVRKKIDRALKKYF